MALSHKDATIVMGMLARGDHNQDIAAWFGENPARVVEVENGTMFGSVQAAPANELPPKGAVGPKARRLRAYAVDALKALKEKGADGIETAIKELEEGLKRFDRHET
jgi:creatinine amidohydrolase/Fe(II)-dependent formamide hydrolase-like protein